MMHRQKKEHGIAAESADFLAGQFAERLDANRTPVPAWTWINLLAHGAENEIRAAAVGALTESGWRQPRAVVAAAIVDMLDEGHWSLDELQRDVLIPLELMSMRSTKTDPRDPDEFFGAVLRTLVAHAARHTGR